MRYPIWLGADFSIVRLHVLTQNGEHHTVYSSDFSSFCLYHEYFLFCTFECGKFHATGKNGGTNEQQQQKRNTLCISVRVKIFNILELEY